MRTSLRDRMRMYNRTVKRTISICLLYACSLFVFNSWNSHYRKIDNAGERQARVSVPDERLTFSREEFSLNLKPMSPIGIDNMTYDNVNDFPCTQKEMSNFTVDQTDDIMCYSRPNYIEAHLNPCFMEEDSPENPKRVFKCLPYFHVLGFDKCGTTDFHSRLSQHPQILNNCGALGKETYFWSLFRPGLNLFTRFPKQHLWDYKKCFQNMATKINSTMAQTNQNLITGDATPMDVWDFRGWPEDPQNKGLQEPRFLTPHAMRHIYKNPKFFLLVRNPVDRLYTDYLFLGYGFTARQFAKDVPKAVSMMTNCLKLQTIRQCFFSEEMLRKLPVRLHVSCYSVFLREWFSVFNRKHFFIFRTEDYHSNTKEYMRQAFDFLNVAPLSEAEIDRIANESIKHETHNKKTAGPMFPETRAILEEFFARFNEDLAALLDDNKFLWRN
ncbi:carbohydrate sulfotransferase 15-like isoform X1 [Biomphalaria glabrata]|uniref:Carbohydrate sulfotransferase 15-like isoform X1 n=1 Tax=Biomphalaria glabrata TaxID=6526 RepID=A0A9W2ZYU9_BIOGL|nr:carbohydrate sulfotransferase 15-like isoform X1 [Biomphalaria glabrata]KAI8755687.1 carbohydrate sulfotransferase 15-like [Biomphalaria glabrata]